MSPKIIALKKQLDSGKLNSDKARILNQVFLSRGVTAYQLEKRLSRIKPTTILARLSDLTDLGIIFMYGQRFHLGNEQPYSIFVYEPDPEKQKQNALNRKRLKFDSLKKRLLTEFSEFVPYGLRNELTQTSIL